MYILMHSQITINLSAALESKSMRKQRNRGTGFGSKLSQVTETAVWCNYGAI